MIKTAFVSSKEWKEFEKRFSDASAFILEKSLAGELRHLRSIDKGSRTRWERGRLDELEKWNSSRWG